MEIDSSEIEDYDSYEDSDDNIESTIPRYEILSTDEIVEQMESAITEINSVIKIPATTTRILLSHLKWDKQELLEKLTDASCDEFFKTAKVLNPFKVALKKKKVTRSKIECAICYTKLSASSMVDLGCGDGFCKDCWSQYLKLKIIDEGAAETITCPASDCGIIVDDGIVMKLVKDKAAKIKYQHLMTDSYVEHNRSLRWCPSPGCTKAIKANDLMVYRSSCLCTCGFDVCFNCGDQAHDPVPCDLMTKWKTNGNEETVHYITKYTKACPKCETLIEKNGGCNHMTCRKCRHEFCWLCFGKWQDHKSCNTYNFDDSDTNESNFYSFNRFQHYYKRYTLHKKSVEIEKSTAVTNANDKIAQLMKASYLTWTDLRFIETSAQILIDCRKQLMNSYIFAYYSKKCNQKDIFEINQSDLELAVETLSQYLEQSLSGESNAIEVKAKILNRSDYCDKRRKQMQDHIYEGYNSDWWTFEN